jgi:phage gp46-like protein
MTTTIHYTVTGSGLAITGGSSGNGRASTLVDAYLFHTLDGGDIEYVNGTLTLSDGLEVAVYLSLFGGNEEDSGRQDTERKQWWGNIGEELAERRYRSETQWAINTLPAIPANLPLIDAAVGRDLAWMRDTGLASGLSVLTTMPGLNRIAIAANIEIGDQRYEMVFATRWSGQS